MMIFDVLRKTRMWVDNLGAIYISALRINRVIEIRRLEG